ncbi:Grx4 family monothiol glutaredoxin [Chloroflexi bacterium TSY]|nr:Grx4 family monothiol glutaredoxin [Chloroflexi bacterium TSY]
MSKQMMTQIDTEVKNTPVMLYMKGDKDFPMCGFSAQVVQILNAVGAAYETRNVLDDDDLRQTIKEYSDWPTIPQLYINGEFVGGCDIAMELYQNGELQKMLPQPETT